MTKTLILDHMARTTFQFLNGHQSRHTTIDDGHSHFTESHGRVYARIALHVNDPSDRTLTIWRYIGRSSHIDLDRITVVPWLSSST